MSKYLLGLIIGFAIGANTYRWFAEERLLSKYNSLEFAAEVASKLERGEIDCEQLARGKYVCTHGVAIPEEFTNAGN